MNAKQAIAERQRLEEEIRTLSRAKAEAHRESSAALARVRELQKAERRQLEAGVRGDEKEAAAAEATRTRIGEALAQSSEAGSRWSAAERARKETERALREHLQAHLEVFATEAEKLSQAAVAKRQAVVDAAEQARAADYAARAAWKPLTGAVRTVAEDGDVLFGEKSGKDLGEMPRPPAMLDSAMSDTLLAAPAPVPEFIRNRKKAERAHRGDVLPRAIARAFGFGEKAA